MFIQLPEYSVQIQELTLIINTLVLIILVIALEFALAELPAGKRKYLHYSYPLLVVFVGLFCAGIYLQGAVS